MPVRTFKQHLAGLAIAVLTVAILVAGTLALHGVAAFEWGLLFSISAWLAVVCAGYLASIGLVNVLERGARRFGVTIFASPVVLGFSVPAIMWLVERAHWTSEAVGLMLAVGGAVFVAFATDWVGRNASLARTRD